MAEKIKLVSVGGRLLPADKEACNKCSVVHLHKASAATIPNQAPLTDLEILRLRTIFSVCPIARSTG